MLVGQILSSCENAVATVDGKFLSAAEYQACVDANFNYKWSEAFFVGLAGLGMIVGLILNWDDHTNRNSQLNRTKKSKQAAEASEKIN